MVVAWLVPLSAGATGGVGRIGTTSLPAVFGRVSSVLAGVAASLAARSMTAPSRRCPSGITPVSVSVPAGEPGAAAVVVGSGLPSAYRVAVAMPLVASEASSETLRLS